MRLAKLAIQGAVIIAAAAITTAATEYLKDHIRHHLDRVFGTPGKDEEVEE